MDHNLLDAFLAKTDEVLSEIESKTRHVRDSEFWDAPVGTPLPLGRAARMPKRRPKPKPTTIERAKPDQVEGYLPRGVERAYDWLLEPDNYAAFIEKHDQGGGCEDIAAAVESRWGVRQVYGTWVAPDGAREYHSWNESGDVILDAAQYVFWNGDGDGPHTYPADAPQYEVEGDGVKSAQRHVRDAAYWGAPVGTPLPLAGRKPSSPSFSMPSRNTFQYGTITGPIHTEESRPGARMEMAFSDFDYWQGNYAVRTISARMMGIEGVQSYGDDVGPHEVIDAIDTGAINPDNFVHYEGDYNDPDRTPKWVMDKVNEHINATWVLMQASKMTTLDYLVYRGIAVKDDHPLMSAKKGDTISFPISAFSPDFFNARSFSLQEQEGESSVVFVLQSGAHVAHNTADISSVFAGNQTADRPGDATSGWVERPIETVAQGKFEIIGVKTMPGGGSLFMSPDPTRLIAIKQTHYFDIDSGEYVHV